MDLDLDLTIFKGADLDLDLDLKNKLDLDLDLNIAGFAHHCWQVQLMQLEHKYHHITGIEIIDCPLVLDM